MCPHPPRSTPSSAASRQAQLFWVGTETYNRWPLFHDALLADITATCFQSKEALEANRLLAWVLLPDQAQWLIRLAAGARLERCVSRLKALSTRDLNHFQGRRGPVWEISFRHRCLAPAEDPRSVAQQIIEAPVAAGLASDLQEYIFCHSAWATG